MSGTDRQKEHVTVPYNRVNIAMSVFDCVQSTAGLLIGYTVGRRHNFCCRGLILIPRPDSETSAQITRVNVLDFFCKT